THIRTQGDKWIFTELERPEESESIQFGGWTRVQALPLKELIPSLLWFFLKLGLFAIAVLVFWKRPTDLSATLFYLLGVVTLGAFMGGYHWTRIASDPKLILVFMLCAVLLPAVLLHFYLVFPTPKPTLLRRPFTTLCAIYTVPVCFLVILI